MKENKKIVFGCCLCGKGMVVPKNDDFEVTIIINKTGQNFWCHKECLKQRMNTAFREQL